MSRLRELALARRKGLAPPVYQHNSAKHTATATGECGGCQKRKEWMNSVIPGSGDMVEKITEVTGIKKIADTYFGDATTEKQNTSDTSRPPSDH